MEIIGEGAEDEDNAEKEKDQSVDDGSRAIHGLRLSTPMLENENRSRPVSPTVSRSRSLSSAAAPDEAADARRREAIATAVPGRVRRSAQQERGTGDPLFPSSFATLAMGPSLVAKYVIIMPISFSVPLRPNDRVRMFSFILPHSVPYPHILNCHVSSHES